MQQRKNIRLLILFGALLLITVITYVVLNRSTTFTVDPSLFKTTDLQQVNRVVLSRGTAQTELTFDGVRWTVNGALADRDMIDVLFATLQQVEAKRPVASTLQDSIAQVLETSGVNVTLFEDDRQTLSFVAGGNAQKTQAYFKLTEDNVPYIMMIPGYRVYASGIFELNPNDWRDKYVFNFNWRNFQRLAVHFPDKPADDFEVALIDAGYFSITGAAAVDTTRLNNYLDHVSLLTVDQYLSELATKPTTTSVILSAYDVAGKRYSLTVASEPTPSGLIPVLINDSIPAGIQQAKARELLRPRSFFVDK